jgi:hypothetical protein
MLGADGVEVVEDSAIEVVDVVGSAVVTVDVDVVGSVVTVVGEDVAEVVTAVGEGAAGVEGAHVLELSLSLRAPRSLSIRQRYPKNDDFPL